MGTDPVSPRRAVSEAASVEATALARVHAYLSTHRPAGESQARVEPLSGDASTRRYYRVHGAEGRSVVALYPEPFDPAGHPFLEVQALLRGFGLAVPELLGVDGACGVIVQQDLGDRTLQLALEGAGPARRQECYREATDALVHLQARAAAGPRAAACFGVAFDVEKLSWELHYFQKHFLEGWRDCELSAEDRSALAEAFHALSAEIASWPRVLCHRDYHSRNLMEHGGRLYWIDFQDSRMGPSTYDLASLLRDAYVEVPAELHDEMVERFRLACADEAPREEFLRRYALVGVQRNLKALGTFGFMASVRDNPAYLPYVPRTLRHVRDNLSRHRELERLWRTLARHLPELT